jgi:hypothetical protein
VVRAARDVDDRAADVDVARRGGGLVIADPVLVAVAEPPVAVEPPASGAAIRQDGARMKHPRREIDDGSADVDITGRGGVSLSPMFRVLP